jgi:transcriptional regulator with XRE-family HTH domain
MQTAQLKQPLNPNTRNKYFIPINHRLKMARIRKEMSAQSVVDALKKRGISIGLSTLQGYEADENSANHRFPSISAIYSLAKFYDVSVDYLFGLTDIHESPTKRKPKNDCKHELKHNKQLHWGGKVLSADKRELITAQIDFIVARNPE